MRMSTNPNQDHQSGSTLRFLRNRYLLLGDLFLIVASVLGSFVLRLNIGPLLLAYLDQMAIMLLLALIIKPLLYYIFGLYRRLWIYASIQEMQLIGLAVTAASITLSISITLLQAVEIYPGFSRMVLFIDWLLSLFAVGGLRLSMRIIYENQQLAGGKQRREVRRVLIVGAGSAGAMAAREMQRSSAHASSQAGLQPVGFVDDDPNKQRHEIHGVPVLGTLQDIPTLVQRGGLDEVIIAIPSAPGSTIRNVIDICRVAGVPCRTIPGLTELIGGQVNVTRLREVEIADLLRRTPISIDTESVEQSLCSQRVLVTGAGGSIGSELCRQIASWKPAELIMVGHGENSIFENMLELKEFAPNTLLYPLLGDIRDATRLRQIFERHKPQVVFHTAAHKHVGLMELNIEEAVTNNIIGTFNVIQAAVQTNVERLVMVSSDKAVRPTSVMGATKRIAEKIVLAAAQHYQRQYTIVRFGNVLGSRGSIVPIFKRQIARGGPITITHPEMRRFFMTIPEAVHLILQAFSMGQSGDAFVLKMGEQVRIVDLAEDLIRLSGLEPYQDIQIVFTGAKPGEKLSEELWDEGYSPLPSSHPDILRLPSEKPMAWDAVESLVHNLAGLAQAGRATSLEQALREAIPGAVIHARLPGDLGPVV